MWQTCLNKCLSMGLQIEMNAEVKGLAYENEIWKINLNNNSNHSDFDVVISSAAIRDIIPNIHPAIQNVTLQSVQNLNYRDFITVVLITERP
jgi:protoporphyrinogen oxidase